MGFISADAGDLFPLSIYLYMNSMEHLQQCDQATGMEP